MKVLILLRPAPNASPEQMRPHLAAETRHAWEMYKGGTARELYMRADGRGAVLVLESADAAAAAQAAGELPLVKAGLAVLEIIPLAPFWPFENLQREAPAPVAEKPAL